MTVEELIIALTALDPKIDVYIGNCSWVLNGEPVASIYVEDNKVNLIN